MELVKTLTYTNEFKFGLDTVLEVGKSILLCVENHKAEKHGLEFKAEVDTIADQTGTKFLIDNFPNDAILTEEQGLPKEPKSRMWVCDFLDGTTNFLNGSKNYSVLLAFVEKGEIKVGISYLPTTNDFFYAVKGEGAYWNNQKICTSSINNLKMASIMLDQGYDPEGSMKFASLYQKLRPDVGAIGAYNANGVALSLLAKGEMGGYVHFSSKIWESAGILIAQEAGARITDFNGGELKLDFTSDKGFEFVATNGLIHEELLAHL